MISILIIIIGIGGLIFVHELGHFLVAKWSGVKVEVFSVGFGWKFLSYQWGETQYALSIIPLGGYVKMAGELPNEERTGADYELHSKPAWKRFWIFSAGSLMNLLVVFPICMLMFWIGVDRHQNEIGQVAPGSPEWEAGVKPGTKLVGLQIQEKPGPVDDASDVEWGPRQAVSSLEAYRETVLWLYPDQHVKLFLSSSDGSETSFVVDPPDDIRQQSLSPFAKKIRYIKQNSPADRAGLKRGDVLVSMNGKEVRHLLDIRQLIDHHVDPRLRYVIKRSNGEKEIHELAVEQGTPYMIRTDGERIPVYRLSEEVNLRKRFDLSDGDRIVRINDRSISHSTNASASNKPADYEAVQLEQASSGPMSILLKRPVKKDGKKRMVKKSFSMYPKVFKTPDYNLTTLLEPVIKGVQTGSPADRAGLKAGDRILSVDDQAVPSMSHLTLWLNDRAGDELSLTYRRDGQEKETTIVPRGNVFGAGEIGVSFSRENPPIPLPELSEHSGFAQSGFQKGDRILAFYDQNGIRKTLVDFEQQADDEPKGVNRLQRFVGQHRPDNVKLQVKRTVDGTEKTMDIVYTPEQDRMGQIGIRVGPETYEKQTSFTNGISEGFNRGADLYALTIIGIQKMFQDTDTAKQGLAGPVRIASLSYRAVEQDVGQFLKILAMISISLGLLNLLPIPPLDGGHILFLFLEVLRGKPLGEEVLYKIQLAGFLFFILLFIVITYNDIVNVFGM